jgi:hypothetical protein
MVGTICVVGYIQLTDFSQDIELGSLPIRDPSSMVMRLRKVHNLSDYAINGRFSQAPGLDDQIKH